MLGGVGIEGGTIGEGAGGVGVTDPPVAIPVEALDFPIFLVKYMIAMKAPMPARP